MKIRYVSSFAVGTLHAVINRALLGMLCDIYPGKVDCHASQSTVDELTDGLGIDKKDIHTVFVPSGSSRRNTLLRYIFSAFTNLRDSLEKPARRHCVLQLQQCVLPQGHRPPQP